MRFLYFTGGVGCRTEGREAENREQNRAKSRATPLQLFV